ncbi:MAG: RtcB family protein [Candidatus Micrarchaeia archaeon]
MSELKKVSDAIWKIEKEESMNVPAYVFGTERIVQKMKGDKTFIQLKNAASLPGIIDRACVMPDGHEGYGFPIGGVAAFDANEGIVSPGGIGYDINCLHPDSKILTSLGYTKKIKEFENDFSFMVQTNGTILMHGKSSLCTGNLNRNAISFMYKQYEGILYSVSTLSNAVSLTPDHPIFTINGKKLPDQLKEGDLILVYPFEGVQYSPLDGNEEEIARYAKLLGYLTGDGTLTYCGKKLRVTFFGKEKDLEKIKEDVTFLGYHSHLRTRTRKHKINEKEFISTNSELHVYSDEFAKKLLELEAPLGNKTKTIFRIPNWIRQSPLWIKRLYLASLFGAELSSPKTSSKTGFYMPILSMNKEEKLEENLRGFFLDLTELLKEFSVEVSKIAFVEKIKDKIRLRLEIDGTEENIENLYSKIGFEYNEDRLFLGLCTILYIRYKRQYRDKREEIRAKVVEYKSKGFSLKELQKRFSGKWANNRFIERAYYENKSARAPLSIKSFNDFAAKQKEYYSSFGALASPILDISKTNYSGKVFDFTIEGVHKFIAQQIVVSNCGVRLLTTNLTEDQVRPKIKELCDKLFKNVPSGVGSESKLKISHEELDSAVELGIDWAIEKGYGRKEDKQRTEEYGRMIGADATAVSPTAKKRGKTQFGTLGAGNHFLEIQKIEKIHDENSAKSFGLEEGKIAVMIHCGSRGYGHQICSDALPILLTYARKNNISLPDPELVYAPIQSEEGQKYLKGMQCGVNYAFINRHVIMHWVRETFDEVFGKGTSDSMNLVYDVAHNIAKFEKHLVNGKTQELLVHRKGATRAFPKGREELPIEYRSIGQPVLIPGSMGTASYVLVGEEKGLEVSWGSTCHGAGRVMSRGEAIRSFRGDKLRDELWNQNKIYVRATNPKVIAEEAPNAYKDVDEVVESVVKAGISKITARMKPIGVVKG